MKDFGITTWDYKGYLVTRPDGMNFQMDWNSTLLSKINSVDIEIANGLANKTSLKVHPSLVNILNTIPYFNPIIAKLSQYDIAFSSEVEENCVEVSNGINKKTIKVIND